MGILSFITVFLYYPDVYVFEVNKDNESIIVTGRMWLANQLQVYQAKFSIVGKSVLLSQLALSLVDYSKLPT